MEFETIQGIASFVYVTAALCSLLIAIDFFRTRDGILRKILIAIFLSWAIHYGGMSLLMHTDAPTATRVMFGMIFSTLDFFSLLSLYLYFKWRQ